MRSLPIIPAFLLLALGCSTSVAELGRLPAAPMGETITPLILSNEFVVAGEVIGRSEVAFTVLSAESRITTVKVNPDTSILKGAETIRLSEVMVGDKVTAVVMRSGDGSLQAVKVEVSTGYN